MDRAIVRGGAAAPNNDGSFIRATKRRSNSLRRPPVAERWGAEPYMYRAEDNYSRQASPSRPSAHYNKGWSRTHLGNAPSSHGLRRPAVDGTHSAHACQRSFPSKGKKARWAGSRTPKRSDGQHMDVYGYMQASCYMCRRCVARTRHGGLRSRFGLFPATGVTHRYMAGKAGQASRHISSSRGSGRKRDSVSGPVGHGPASRNVGWDPCFQHHGGRGKRTVSRALVTVLSSCPGALCCEG